MFHRISWVNRIAGLAIALLLTLLAYPASAGQASLSWNASASTSVAGCKIHYGTASASYSSHVDVGNVQSATVSNLNAGGTYYFAVTAYNSAGERGYSNEATTTIPVVVAAPVAAFTASPLAGTAPLTTAFASTSTGTITGYLWEFGDGTTSTLPAPGSHNYGNVGTYSVKLTVSSAGGSSSATQIDR